jgi:rod shape-determining protein MreC
MVKLNILKKVFHKEFTNESIVYTSGTGAIFKSGIPIGKLKVSDHKSEKKIYVDFYSDFSQLKYVFAEVLTKTEIQNLNDTSSSNNNPMGAKLNILEDEIKIIEDSNSKFKQENENLILKINDLKNELSKFEEQITNQENTIKQFNIDQEELKFLRLNLTHGHKCRKTFLNTKGFIAGTPDYKKCVLRKE